MKHRCPPPTQESKAEYRSRGEGFSLIELMVVLLIMAILLAIAIPTFLSSSAGAQDRAAQATLANALTSARALGVSGSTYGPVKSVIDTLSTDEPDISFVKNAAVEGSNEVSVNVSSSGLQIVLVSYSGSGICWAASDNTGDAPSQAWGQAPIGVTYVAWNPSLKGGKACNAASAFGGSEGAALSGLGWGPAFPVVSPEAKP